jgi:hypothetical protein
MTVGVSGSFFEKKEPKKLLIPLGHGPFHAHRPSVKGFLRSFASR